MSLEQRGYPVIRVTKKAEDSLRAGHPWVYDAELTEGLPEEETAYDGELVDVVSSKGRYLGTGFYNSHSKIRIRLISTNANDRFDEAFWERRLKYCVDYRKTVMGEDFSCCRLIFGEADQFPGLTVDLFTDVLVVQTLSLGMDRRKQVILPALVRILSEAGVSVKGVYERNDNALRIREGLSEGKGFYPIPGLNPDPEWKETEICENGIFYRVDFVNGQKTGFFLDQKYNRKAVRPIAKGRKVLDCFTHTGSFALNAAKAGALHVTAVDISQDAVDMARANALRNGLEGNMDFVTADVFDLLTQMDEEGRRGEYDFIILDPPAFTKSRKTVDSAMRGYKQINLRAMRLLPRGGYLATASCSHFMENELFRKMLKAAAKDAGVTLRQIECRTQGPDHPILWNVPETDYLKFYLFQIV